MLVLGADIRVLPVFEFPARAVEVFAAWFKRSCWITGCDVCAGEELIIRLRGIVITPVLDTNLTLARFCGEIRTFGFPETLRVLIVPSEPGVTRRRTLLAWRLEAAEIEDFIAWSEVLDVSIEIIWEGQGLPGWCCINWGKVVSGIAEEETVDASDVFKSGDSSVSWLARFFLFFIPVSSVLFGIILRFLSRPLELISSS